MTILRPSQDIINGGWQGSPPSIVTSKQVWRQQPQTSVGVDWSNPITQGLTVAVNFSNGSGSAAVSINGKILAITGGLLKINALGKAISASGTLNVQGDRTIPNPFTFMTVCVPTSTSTQVYLSGGSAAGLYFGIQGGNWTHGSAVLSGIKNTYIARRTSGNYIKTCANGVLGTDTYNTTAFSAGNHVYGSYGGSSYPISGTANLYAIWNRSLSDVEMLSISANPWQIFTPIKRTTFFLPPLYDTLDETTASDADYIATSSAGDIARVGLGTYADAAPSIILKRDVWTQQPQTSVGIDWSSGILAPKTTLQVLSAGSGLNYGIRTNSLLPISGTMPTLGVGAGRGIQTTLGAVGGVDAIQLINAALSNKCTILIVRSLTSLTYSGQGQYGYSGGPADRVQVHLPYTDGTIYWDFGNATAGSGRLSVAQTWAVGVVETFAFVAGPTKGREIWRNGVKIASNVSATASLSNLPYPFRVGAAYGVGGGSSSEIIYQFALVADELPDAKISKWSRNPWQIFRKQPKPIFIASPRGTHSLKYRAASPEADRGLIARVLELGQPPAIVLKRDIWTSQPQSAVGIDWGNPLTRGLRVAILPSLNRCVVSNQRLVGYAGRTARTTVVGHGGIRTDGVVDRFIGLRNPASASDSNALLFDVAGEITVIAVATQTTETNNGLTFGRYSGYSTNYAVGLYGGSFDGAATRLGTYGYTPTAAGNSRVGKLSVVGITGDGSTARSYIDGLEVHNGAYSAPIYEYNANEYYVRTLLIGSDGVGGANNTAAYLGMVWNRALSAQEVASLSANPYQIFKKQPKPIFIDAPKVIASQTKTAAELSSTALILKRDIWTSQPQSAVGIDWGNPLTSGLVGIRYRDSNGISEKLAVNGGILLKASSRGTGIDSSSSSKRSTEVTGRVTGNATLFALVDGGTSAESIAIEYGNPGQYGDGTRGLRINSGKLSPYTRDFSAITGTTSINGSNPYTIAVTYKGAATVAYLNGAVEVSGTTKTTGPYGTIAYGDTTGTTSPFYWHGTMYAAYVWNRALSASEVKALSDNPWQIFKKQPKPLYFDLGPNEHNLTLSSEETSSITDNSELALEVEST